MACESPGRSIVATDQYSTEASCVSGQRAADVPADRPAPVYTVFVKPITQARDTPSAGTLTVARDIPSIRPRRRFLRLSWFLAGVIAHVFWFDIVLASVRLTRWYARRSALRRYGAIAREFRHIALALGGVLIKLGQFLSARADILPAVITDELADLQDEVPAAPLALVMRTIVDETGQTPDALFAAWDAAPVAAASLGQVYFARLHDGRDVAVKVQRPRIDEIVDVDLRALQWAVKVVRNYPRLRRRANLDQLFDEFARVLREELDYTAEARHALQFRANLPADAGVYVPEPYVDLSTRRVLVMERVGGIKLNDYAALEAAGIERRTVAARLYRAFLQQIFIDGFFHADPHPGNLFVRPDAARQVGVATPFTIMLLDCGMVGHLPRRTIEIIRSGMVAVAANDAERIVAVLERMRMILPGADRRQIVRAVELVLQHTYDRNQRELGTVDVERIFAETEDLIRDLPFQIPQDLIYLGRSVSLVSGIVTGLDPEINLFDGIRPFARDLAAAEGQDWLATLRDEAGDLTRALLALPRRMDQFYATAQRGDLRVVIETRELERHVRRVERATNRLAGAVIAAAALLGGVALQLGGAVDEARLCWLAAGLAAWLSLRRGRT